MKGMKEKEWTEWKRKRKHSFIGYIITGMVTGLDYSFMFSSLYLYLKDVIKTPRPDFFYGAIIAIYCISSTFFGPILARWTDKERKMRRMSNFSLFLQLVGVVLYMVPTSVVYPLVGRFISGIGDPYISVCTGEIIRIYDQEEGTAALWWLAAANSFGDLIGPVIVIFFHNVDFHIGTLHFNQLNSVGFLVAGLLVVTLVLTNVLIHDCSAMFDLKSYIEVGGETLEVTVDKVTGNITINDISESSGLLRSASRIRRITTYTIQSVQGDDDSDDFNNEGPLIGSGYVAIEGSIDKSAETGNSKPERLEMEVEPVSQVLRTLFTNINSILMYTSTFVFVYALFALEIILPLLTVIILKWSLTSLVFLYLGNAALYFLVVLFSAKYCVTDRAVYKLLLISTVAVILSFVIILLLSHFRHNFSVCVLLVVFYEIMWAFGWVLEEVLLRCTLAKMVPSRCQNFTEALRNGASRLSMVMATLTVPLALPHLAAWCTSVIVATVLLLVMFVWRRKTLVLIREVKFNKQYLV